MFEFNLPEIADHLNSAFDRGVRVKVIVDLQPDGGDIGRAPGHQRHHRIVAGTKRRLPHGEPRLRGDPVIYLLNRKHHLRLQPQQIVIFSRIVKSDGTSVPNVVLQTSSNLSTWYENITFNDSITFSDAITYNGYKKNTPG